MFKDDLIGKKQLYITELYDLPDAIWGELQTLYFQADYSDAERRIILKKWAKILDARDTVGWTAGELTEDAERLLYELRMQTCLKNFSVLPDCLASMVVTGKFTEEQLNDFLEKYNINFRYSGKKGWESAPKKTIIFISRSSKDKDYVRRFVELLEDIGLDASNIFCSSIPSVPGYAIPLGKNIFSFIRELYIENQLIVCYMLSDNYYSNVPCLNEMGAAWVSQQEYLSVLLPGFEYREIEGAVDAGKVGIKLDDDDAKFRLKEFMLRLQERFGLKRLPDHQLNRYIEDFLEQIESLIREGK